MEYRMASSAQNVYRLLDDLIEAYKPTAVQERAEVVALAKELEGDDFDFQPWDTGLLLLQVADAPLQPRPRDAPPLF